MFKITLLNYLSYIYLFRVLFKLSCYTFRRYCMLLPSVMITVRVQLLGDIMQSQAENDKVCRPHCTYVCWAKFSAFILDYYVLQCRLRFWVLCDATGIVVGCCWCAEVHRSYAQITESRTLDYH